MSEEQTKKAPVRAAYRFGQAECVQIRCACGQESDVIFDKGVLDTLKSGGRVDGNCPTCGNDWFAQKPVIVLPAAGDIHAAVRAIGKAKVNGTG